MLFAVYDGVSGEIDYIPPEYVDIPDLIDELVSYVIHTDDHPLIVAAVVHYQLVTIHPFEDGNGRTARLLSGYILDREGYGFNGAGSLEEFFAYDADDNDRRMTEAKRNSVQGSLPESLQQCGLSYLNAKEKELLCFLIQKHLYEFTPAEVSVMVGVTNKTIINRCVKLVNNGFIVPILGKQRIRSYKLSDMTRANEKLILASIQNN